MIDLRAAIEETIADLAKLAEDVTWDDLDDRRARVETLTELLRNYIAAVIDNQKRSQEQLRNLVGAIDFASQHGHQIPANVNDQIEALQRDGVVGVRRNSLTDPNRTPME